jgi:glycosyltransferase involved in cell wall biosynthesis
MKILIASGIYPPDIGGPAQYARNLYNTWRAQGHDVKVAAFRWERAFPPGIRHLLYWSKIIRKGWNADLILVLDTWSAAVPTMYACRLMGKKYVLRTGGDFLWETYVERTGEKVLFREFYEKNKSKLSRKERIIFKQGGKALRHAAAVIFSTKWQREIFEKAYNLDPAKSVIVENYISGPGEMIEPENRSFIGGVRSLTWKNLDTLSNAFDIARNIVKEKGLPPIDLDLGKCVYDSFVEKIHRSYAVILVSIGDISPNMIFDAIRAGTPFIVTKETGITERIKDVAIFVDPENQADITEKIIWLADPVNRKAQVDKLRKFSFTHSWEDIAAEIIQIGLNKK